MTKRIYHSICFVALTVFFASLIIIMGALYGYYSRIQRSQLKAQTVFAAQSVAHEGMDYLIGLGIENYRITWISGDGTVLYDSKTDSIEMENHLERDEIRQALETGYGESARYSATLMEQTVYAAQLLPDGTVLRLSMAQYSILTLVIGMGRSICLMIIVAAVLSLWLAHRLSRNIVQPLNNLNLDDPLSNADYEELRPLLNRIETQQLQLKGQATQLKRKQRELDTVTNNMTEGLVLMNESCSVLTMNRAAARIMGLVRPFVGIAFLQLNHAQVLESLLHSALEGNHAEQTVTLPLGDYHAAASPVLSGGKVCGVVLLLFDITQKKRLELQRREFTANVSHELKTPLHVISGYAELLKSGFVRSEDVAAFSEKIYTESQRMVRLIEDILKLSRLDEGADGLTKERTDLFRLAEDVIRELTDAARQAGITMNLSGTNCLIDGFPHLITGIITNLCTNAIKYNTPGGRVDITVSDHGSEAVLTVADTGIGIPPEHQERIFERFYRVDKSHSKAVGGTGLGLSIVKHAALIHNAAIDLTSAPGAGTTISIHFPKTKP
ncbi:MAG: PAS domain-containing sensor histidine kinase [Oscillospiraceae bacterium]|nr:PAS domain-containing sensor histidine kinase [Oscillospiraceae bacterium]